MACSPTSPSALPGWANWNNFDAAAGPYWSHPHYKAHTTWSPTVETRQLSCPGRDLYLHHPHRELL